MNKILDLTKYSREDFKRFSIFELRDIAAFFGVVSPTSHSKVDLLSLIDQMRTAKDGGVEQPKEHTPIQNDSSVSLSDEGKMRGRPPKDAEGKYIFVSGKDALLNNSDLPYPMSQQPLVGLRLYDGLSVYDNESPYLTLNDINSDRPKIKKIEPVKGYSSPAQSIVYKSDSIEEYLTAQYKALELVRLGQADIYEGILQISPKRYGFIRAKADVNDPSRDAHVEQWIIDNHNLSNGDQIKAIAIKQNNDKSAKVICVIEINGLDPKDSINCTKFEDLIAVFPNEKYSLEAGSADRGCRLIDIIAPIGKGQRALIVSPPKSGKTTLIKNIASSLANSYKDSKLIIVLVDERPEEVMDFKRSITNAEIFGSTFDNTSENHIKICDHALNIAKNYVECGKDAIIILDSITRLARAYNNAIEYSGRSLSGGLDPYAMNAPKKFFGSARKIDGGGSLTIIATALIETGSKLDDIIYEEFKGTGNMEIILDRKLSERRIFPAVDLSKSSTRCDDLLLSADELIASYNIKNLASKNNSVIESIINELSTTNNNEEFIKKFNHKCSQLKSEGYKTI